MLMEPFGKPCIPTSIYPLGIVLSVKKPLELTPTNDGIFALTIYLVETLAPFDQLDPKTLVMHFVLKSSVI